MKINPTDQRKKDHLREWNIFRGRGGRIRWFQRFYEVGLIISGQWSLHRAWQKGKDEGNKEEYRRLITNGAAAFELLQKRYVENAPENRKHRNE